MFGLPGGSNGGLPMGPIAFWFLIILTVMMVIGFVFLIIYVVDQIEMENTDHTASAAVNPPGARDFANSVWGEQRRSENALLFAHQSSLPP